MSPNRARTTPPPADVESVLSDVSPARLRADVDRLAAFGTRHTHSDGGPDRGIGAARQWLLEEFARISEAGGRTGDAAVRVALDSLPTHLDGTDGPLPNVVCEIPGTMPEAAGRRYVVVAHYDSRAGDRADAVSDAPGANDDGSGVAALLELARVLVPRRLDATVVLLAVAGEEQGLVGSRQHAAAARERGDDIRAVIGNDMVGDPSGVAGRPAARGRVRVFARGLPPDAPPELVQEIALTGGENDGPSRQLARFVAEVARRHGTTVQPVIVYRTDRFLRGGDHLAFLEQGYPAVRVTDVHEKYERQHQDVRTEDGVRCGDLPEFVDEDYLADVTRLDTAVLVHLANAPSSPADARIVVEGLGHDTLLRWSPVPEPDLAGYEVVWRATTAPDWQHSLDVGDVVEARLDLQVDDWLFGVRAYDRQGYTSPVSFPGVERP